MKNNKPLYDSNLTIEQINSILDKEHQNYKWKVMAKRQRRLYPRLIILAEKVGIGI